MFFFVILEILNFNQNFTLSYRIKNDSIFLSYPNLLSTSKLWHILCFKNNPIILVFAITFLTIYIFFLSRSNHLYLFCSLCVFCMGVLLYILFPLAQGLQLDATDPFIFIIFVFHNLLMLMFDMLVKSLVLAEVKATLLTFENRNCLFPIYNLSPNHDQQQT